MGLHRPDRRDAFSGSVCALCWHTHQVDSSHTLPDLLENINNKPEKKFPHHTVDHLVSVLIRVYHNKHSVVQQQFSFLMLWEVVIPCCSVAVHPW